MFRIRGFAAAVVSGVVAVALAAVATPSASATAPATTVTAAGGLPSWKQDFVEHFDGPLKVSSWGRYQSATKQHMMHSRYLRSNVYTKNGSLIIRTQRDRQGTWTSGGVSGNPGFAAAQGRWEIRARFDRAPGIGYAFLLYPRGGGWPPEVDFAEGTAGKTSTMASLHWSPRNLVQNRFLHNIDLTRWHTYGVILSDNKVEFTFDGAVWATLNTAHSPRIPMWIGFQAGAKAPGPRVTGEIVGPATPADSKIYIDYVAHWKRT